MSTRQTTIEAVAGGTETIETCPDCEAERVTMEMQALVAEGTINLGLLVDCDGCGKYFTCQSCGHRVEVGAPIIQHIVDEHGGDRG